MGFGRNSTWRWNNGKFDQLEPRYDFSAATFRFEQYSALHVYHVAYGSFSAIYVTANSTVRIFSISFTLLGDWKTKSDPDCAVTFFIIREYGWRWQCHVIPGSTE